MSADGPRHREHAVDCRTCGGRLVRVERGAALDAIELIDDAGVVYLVRAWGVHDDERSRTREAVLKLLRGVLAPSR